jgi:hypothetical protein
MTSKDELDPNVKPRKFDFNKKNIDVKKENKKEENLDNLPIKAYLDKTVIPIVLEGMAEVARVRPENSIKYMADFLYKHAND